MFKNSLSELFSDEDKQSLSNQGRIVLVDSHNMAYRTLFSAIFMSPEDNEKFYFWKHLFMNSFFNTIVKFNPEKVVLAFDTKGSWRYQIFQDYKSKRKIARDKAVVDFEKFFPIFEEFKNDIKETFSTIYVLDCPKCEADDIIAVLTKEKFKANQNIIVSTDKDLNQLLLEQNNQQYDPIQGRMMNCINPKKDLELKVIKGDKSDCIPAIKSRIGLATAEAILRNGVDDYLEKEGEIIKNNYVRNRLLIDFNFIPKDISNSILNVYNEYPIKEMNSLKIMNFFTKHKLNKMMDEWTLFSPLIKSLK